MIIVRTVSLINQPFRLFVLNKSHYLSLQTTYMLIGHVKTEQSDSVFTNPPVTDRHYVMTRHTVCSALVNVLF